MSDSPKRASLLGLPRELRLHIYSYVRETDIGFRVLDRFHDGHNRDRGFQTTPIRSNEPFYLPWLALMLTCRTIASEISLSLLPPISTRAYADYHGLVDDVASEQRTCRIDLELTGSGQVGEVKWRTLPCAPIETRFLHARLHFRGDAVDSDSEFSFWGDGGPRGVVRSLYQTLNLFLHCGPRLDANNPLAAPVHLEELVVEVEDPAKVSADVENEEDCDWVLKHLRRSSKLIAGYLTRLADTGLLFGYVDRLRVVGCDGAVSEIAIREVRGARVPAFWDGYGFEWGVWCE